MESKSTSSTRHMDLDFGLLLASFNEGLALAQAKEEQRKKEDSIRRKTSIYKIPPLFRETDRDREAYTPQLVSLGPYHHGQSHLHSMEEHKWRVLDCALDRHKQQLEVYIDAIREVEERARACYQEPLCQSSKEFVEMMVLDACFVLEMLRFAVYPMECRNLGYSEYDPVFSIHNYRTIDVIRRDMILVENQVPLFVLDKLLRIQEGPDNRTGNITWLTLCFFQPITNWDKQQLGGLHCLEVLWRSLMVFQAETMSASDHGLEEVQQMSVPCAIELRGAGIKFEKQNTTVLSDIAFRNGILKVPPLLIDDWTESFFFNLTAYEKCADNNMYYANSYIVFMCDLIQSPKDVRYLKECGIIQKLFKTDDEVVEMFNRLGQRANVGANGSSLKKVSLDVNDYCQDKSNAWKRNLRESFKDNWIFYVWVALMLLLEMVRTFYTVYGFYYKPQ